MATDGGKKRESAQAFKTHPVNASNSFIIDVTAMSASKSLCLLCGLLLLTVSHGATLVSPSSVVLDALCLAPRNLRVGKCICWVLFATGVKLRKSCNRFRRTGKLNVDRLIKAMILASQ